MPIGAHVRAGGDLLPALRKGADIGAEVVQVFTQGPRAWKPTHYSDEVLGAYRAAQACHPSVLATFCHATYLINLVAPDAGVLDRSRDALVANLAVATAIGGRGLVLHVGSRRGSARSCWRTPPARVTRSATASRSSPPSCRRREPAPAPGCACVSRPSISGPRASTSGRSSGPTRSWAVSTPSSDRTACVACTSTTPRWRWAPTGTGTRTSAGGRSAPGRWAGRAPLASGLLDLPAIRGVPGAGQGARVEDLRAARAALARRGRKPAPVLSCGS